MMRAMRVRLGLLLLALVFLGSCRGEPAGGTLKRVQKRGEITWGADIQGGEPYLWEDPNDPSHIVGFEVDIMEALARRLGVKQRFVQYNWSNLVPSLERGDFDIAMNGLEATAERANRILMSRPYFVYAETLAVRKGAPYTSLADLKGKRVATLNQTYAHDILRDAGVDIALYEGNEEPYLDLENGRVDAVLLDNVIADRYGCTRAAVLCLPDDVARGSYIIGIRKNDPELKAAIDAALEAMIKDGEMQRILEKAGLWDKRQTEAPPPTPAGPKNRPHSFNIDQLSLFFSAALVTLMLSIAAFLLAVPIGVLLAIARVYGGPVAGGVARVYIELFRGTPVLLQLYVIYYGLAPYYAFGPVQAAILGLGLNYGAYEAEVYRGALVSIPRGQSEAARALGMTPLQSLWHVLLPQGLRMALPPMTNDFVSLLKDSSLVSAITVIELTKRMTIAGAEMRGWLVPGLACAALYLALSFPLSEFARRLERKLSHDQRPIAL
jgi:polar amino acid transport system substrate-binding protein